MKKLAILGSTGSIGRQTLEVISEHPAELEVVALSAGSNIDLLEKQIRAYRPAVAVVMEPGLAEELRRRLHGWPVEVWFGMEGLKKIASLPEVDTVVSALSGVIGLEPTWAAVRAGKVVALANKETLVAAGELVMREASNRGTKILPVDSEHSAIFQCLRNETAFLRKILLTASGGPFRTWPAEQLSSVTPAMALRHPNWVMGKKITIDSATLMNKGLEVIEARWLFGVDFDQIEVVIHPQSIIHSMVELADGAILAHLGIPDMRIPIQYALSYPERWPNSLPRLELAALRQLTFHHPDYARFPCLALAYSAGRIGGTLPAVMNAANEVAVELFLSQKIGFLDIPRLVEEVMQKHTVHNSPDLEDILAADRWARFWTYKLASK
ncbi:MAG: 1-deoxy-D-xylulose-5-phosphate reductoisomerase [Firmicutes bacterium]|nr:1-deoxy-D-xylulose-5-phosphate reductoisomerase [Bacillota bacterium]